MRLAFIFLFVLFSTAARAAPQWCDSAPPRPDAHVTAILPAVTENHLQSYRSFTDESERLHGHDTLGLSRSGIMVSYTPRIAVAQEYEHVCAKLVSVEMQFGYSAREILLAREMPEGSCIYGQVRTHEYRHAGVDAYMIESYEDYLDRELAKAAAAVGVLRARTGDDAAEIIAERLSASMQPVVDFILQQREAFQARIDTPQEYARISSVCRADIARYIGQR